MRKYIILFIFCIVFNKLSSQQPNGWDYPQKPGMESWKQLLTAKQRIDACQVPNYVLQNMETSDLIKICLSYPLFKDLYFANSIVTGFNAMINNSNAFQELLKRDNSAKLLLDVYKKMNPKIPNNLNTSTQKGSYTFEFVKLELFLSNQTIFQLYNENEKNILKELLISNYEEKAKAQTEYGIPFGLNPTCLVIARFLDNNPEVSISTNDRVYIKNFINTGIPYDSKFLERIYEAIKN